MINLGNIEIADLRLGTSQVQAAWLGQIQVYGGSQARYDIKSVGYSESEQSKVLTLSDEQLSSAQTLYFKTYAPDLSGKIVCTASYTGQEESIPYASFALSNASLEDGTISGETPVLSTVLPSGSDTVYMKSWIQEESYIEPESAIGKVLNWRFISTDADINAVCFENVGSTTGTLYYKKTRGSAPNLDLVYSQDGQNWSTFDYNVSVEVPSNGKCYVRAGDTGQTSLGSTSDSNHFEMKGSQFKMSGKLMYLLNKTGESQLGPCTFSEAFICCENLVDASELEMPSTVSANYQFNSMFNGCTYLTAAPAELPALSVTGQNTHAWMFAYCGKLSAAPAFRAQSFKSIQGCDRMFYQCSSLVDVPDLSATEIIEGCYSGMFYNCTALKDAPALPAVNPASQSYYQMFQNCNSLSSITVSLTSWSTATEQWTSNVQSTGIFKCPAALGTNETITRGTNNCPAGWTVMNTDAA